MNDQHRTSEQARVAARSVLANLESLDGLGAGDRAQVVALAEALCRGHLDRAATLWTAAQLRALLGATRGLAARTVVSWLDDLCLAA
ncbi:hypothetical protein [Actinomycetospora termitidis]|uniref:Uncharacterized protein n=1 Tax=Actinomycetospora termitidis TaxID=3053470 RepID=A0ABT7MJG0_9PSEU|nr:hypothetical protein [Actinomycetospora sp. Odt1-22]MDL5159493.1 hypothetical protein [Actinomycetospora sp. Odt1-22]